MYVVAPIVFNSNMFYFVNLPKILHYCLKLQQNIRYPPKLFFNVHPRLPSLLVYF